MRKVITGEQVAQLYNRDPFALPAWRAPIYETPGWIIALVQLARRLARIIRLGARHPVAAAVLAVLAFVWVNLGWLGVTALLACAVVILVAWGRSQAHETAEIRAIRDRFQGRWVATIFLACWIAMLWIVENLLRPILTAHHAEVSTLALFIGAIGGASAWGILGLFIGPVLLSFVIALVRFAQEGAAAAA